MTTLDRPMPDEAIKQLREHQTQLDMDGCAVGVSRQALDEVLDYISGIAQPDAGAVDVAQDWDVMEMAEIVLLAAGSSFKHYMPQTKERIIEYLRKYMVERGLLKGMKK